MPIPSPPTVIKWASIQVPGVTSGVVICVDRVNSPDEGKDSVNNRQAPSPPFIYRQHSYSLVTVPVLR